MIQSVQIQNFKSVVDLTLELGTFNVLIGANGCGKSNILEAIAFGAAASADKLDQEFLGSRGIRMTSPVFIVSAFNIEQEEKSFLLNFSSDDKTFKNFSFEPYTIGTGRRWVDRKKISYQILFDKILPEVLSEKDKQLKKQKISEHFGTADDWVLEFFDKTENMFPVENKRLLKLIFENLMEKITQSDFISNYILYSPEQTSLRKFSDTNQIYPLGIKGEGLFQYLKELSQEEKNAEVLNEIKECLLLLDWYQDFNLPKNLLSNEFALNIQDKYLHENLQFFDQRSTNEGFLFLLFYATLFTSKDTPAFFAIDNIDTSFNPKLCMEVTRLLVSLAKKHGKQVIVTTQNPAILDGLDLSDDTQRLFVVRRNEEGHTKAKRIAYKSERTMKLSEVWTNGFIGGLPDNF